MSLTKSDSADLGLWREYIRIIIILYCHCTVHVCVFVCVCVYVSYHYSVTALRVCVCVQYGRTAKKMRDLAYVDKPHLIHISSFKCKKKSRKKRADSEL